MASTRLDVFADARRMNVALTRAKFAVLVIGDSATLSTNQDWRAFVEASQACGAYHQLGSSPPAKVVVVDGHT